MFCPECGSGVPDNAKFCLDYDARTLDGFRRALSEGAFSLTTPPRNARGLLTAQHGPTGLPFVLVPAGEFRMGSDESAEEQPIHTVRVPGFLLSVTPCTQEAWDRIGGGDERKWRGPKLPIDSVTWNEVQDWCRRAGLRLPSEAEWEYACRAGTTTRFSFGDSEGALGHHGWFFRNSGNAALPPNTEWDRDEVLGKWGCRTHPVGEKQPNPWGLHDLHGNVWEWCEDLWHDNYEGAPAGGGPRTEGAASNRVYRGGGWSSSAGGCRSAVRYWIAPSCRGPDLGFRPAASLPQDSRAMGPLARPRRGPRRPAPSDRDMY